MSKKEQWDHLDVTISGKTIPLESFEHSLFKQPNDLKGSLEFEITPIETGLMAKVVNLKYLDRLPYLECISIDGFNHTFKFKTLIIVLQLPLELNIKIGDNYVIKFVPEDVSRFL